MATSKTLTPTNVTIQIPEFTDQPDQRVNSNCLDKEADAINALNTQIANVSDGTTFSLSSANTSLTIIETYCKSFGKLKYVYVKFQTSATITSWSHLINLGFTTACPFYTGIFSASIGKFLTDTIAYADASNSTIRNFTPLSAGTYAVSTIILSA